MLTLIVNGQVYSPEPRGEIDVLIAGEKIVKLGQVERACCGSTRKARSPRERMRTW